MNKAVVVFLFACFANTGVVGRDPSGPDQTAVYAVTDMVNEQAYPLEAWTLRTREGRFDAKKYEIQEVTKETFGKPEKRTVETYNLWWNESRSGNDDATILREVALTDPANLKAGQKSFGYFEEKDKKTGNIIQNWPVFYTAYTEDGMLRIVSKAFLPGGMRTILIKDTDGNYYLPFRQIFVVVQHGAIISHFHYERMDPK